MFGLTQISERRQQKAEAERAERAFDAARIQPIEIQQQIARQALQECAATMRTLSLISRGAKESFFHARFREIEQKIDAAELHELEPDAITAILAQTLLAVSSGSRDGMESIGRKIAQWSQDILPDFERLQSQLAH